MFSLCTARPCTCLLLAYWQALSEAQSVPMTHRLATASTVTHWLIYRHASKLVLNSEVGALLHKQIIWSSYPLSSSIQYQNWGGAAYDVSKKDNPISTSTLHKPSLLAYIHWVRRRVTTVGQKLYSQDIRQTGTSGHHMFVYITQEEKENCNVRHNFQQNITILIYLDIIETSRLFMPQDLNK